MSIMHDLIQGSIVIAWIVLLAAFAVLVKTADVFVDGAIAIANKLRIPTLVIGIFMVSLATTVPELAVSLISALRGNPEMALGNAIGSVIADDGLALGLAGVVATAPILVIPHVLRTAGAFLIFIQGLCFIFVVSTGSLQRWEGAVLVALFFAYSIYLFVQHRMGRFKGALDLEAIEHAEAGSVPKMLAMFVLGITGIIISANFVITSATTVARSLGIPESMIALTLVALGTSIPEVATSVSAARKGQGALAVGNILGADIMNICWIAGASAIANELVLSRKDIFFMFPAMFLVVGTMLLMLRSGYRLTKKKGVVLLLLYLAYLASFAVMYPLR